jgi:hypothetical protein
MGTSVGIRQDIRVNTAASKVARAECLCENSFANMLYYSVNYETYICDGVEYPQIWANEVIIGPHIQPAGYFSNPAKLKNQP